MVFGVTGDCPQDFLGINSEILLKSFTTRLKVQVRVVKWGRQFTFNVKDHLAFSVHVSYQQQSPSTKNSMPQSIRDMMASIVDFLNINYNK